MILLDSAQGERPTYTVAEVWSNHKWQPNHEQMVAAAADTYQLLPSALNSSYKNPCWYEGQVFKCLPYFQILGVSKCGTTDLYYRLEYHPEMVDCRYKGPHFWDEAAYPRHTRPAPYGGAAAPARRRIKYDKTFAGYLSIFDIPALRIQSNPRHITGEASSNTFTGVHTYLRGRIASKQPPLPPGTNLAQHLADVAPYQRFIVMFRDPVARLYSAFYYYRPRKVGVVAGGWGLLVLR